MTLTVFLERSGEADAEVLVSVFQGRATIPKLAIVCEHAGVVDKVVGTNNDLMLGVGAASSSSILGGQIDLLKKDFDGLVDIEWLLHALVIVGQVVGRDTHISAVQMLKQISDCALGETVVGVVQGFKIN